MRYFLEVSYDGLSFHGSQLQGDLPTVQYAVNKALSTLLRVPIESFGASRTDEGVHALGNFYHFDYEGELHPHTVYKLNALLPLKIAVVNLYEAKNPEMNARFDALSRRYRYKIYKAKNPFKQGRALFHPYPLDVATLNETAAVLKEYLDFETFSKRNTQTFTFKCTIFQSYWEENDDELHYVVEANRFLRGMVRALVGTQIKVNKQPGSVALFKSIIESKDCCRADFSVTGNGLYLEAVNFPEDTLINISNHRI
ncbi:tRNA pseudouridine(38-40) synthase TruA [Taibaiella sp. KBW10]|uniref:tRNA pseudouridine synthase A n=1 Tax=Taibaiella sp. KBW10 TaxID=2153357 RepID=UPI000F5985C6|nr:tRNA pseudouridine synthase A [Taibaiella sp. KBW10]RQO30659.1 tRNA pseudouridine(38-40) synthase TruA [Taibaiella sp. KBW10]